MKKILMIVLASLVLFACNSEQKTLEQSALEKALFAEASYLSQAGSISTLVLSQEVNPMQGCPAEFVSAYKDYIAAWKKLVPIEKKMYEVNYEKARSDINDFLNSFLSDPTGAIIKLKTEWPQFAKELDKSFSQIRESFVEFSNIASRYGVASPTGGISFNKLTSF